MIRRVVAALLALYHGVTGVWILSDARGWLSFVIDQNIPGPPPGTHFIHDVGLAFIASALGFAVFALRPQYWTAAAIGAAFPLLHALMHIQSMATMGDPRMAFDLAAIVAPALLGAFVGWPRRA